MINRENHGKSMYFERSAAILILLGPQPVTARTDVRYSAPAETVPDWSIRGARDTYGLILDY